MKYPLKDMDEEDLREQIELCLDELCFMDKNDLTTFELAFIRRFSEDSTAHSRGQEEKILGWNWPPCDFSNES